MQVEIFGNFLNELQILSIYYILWNIFLKFLSSSLQKGVLGA